MSEFRNSFGENVFKNKYALRPEQTWAEKSEDIVHDVTTRIIRRHWRSSLPTSNSFPEDDMSTTLADKLASTTTATSSKGKKTPERNGGVSLKELAIALCLGAVLGWTILSSVLMGQIWAVLEVVRPGLSLSCTLSTKSDEMLCRVDLDALRSTPASTGDTGTQKPSSE